LHLSRTLTFCETGRGFSPDGASIDPITGPHIVIAVGRSFPHKTKVRRHNDAINLQHDSIGSVVQLRH